MVDKNTYWEVPTGWPSSFRSGSYLPLGASAAKIHTRSCSMSSVLTVLSRLLCVLSRVRITTCVPFSEMKCCEHCCRATLLAGTFYISYLSILSLRARFTTLCVGLPKRKFCQYLTLCQVIRTKVVNNRMRLLWEGGETRPKLVNTRWKRCRYLYEYIAGKVDLKLIVVPFINSRKAG